MSMCATIEVFCPPMCCTSGMCGLSSDNELLLLSHALSWLEQQFGNAIAINRYVFNQEPQEFTHNEMVRKAMGARGGVRALPITLVNGQIVKQGSYPSRAELTTAIEDGSHQEAHT